MLAQPLPILDRRGCGVFGGRHALFDVSFFIFVFDIRGVIRRAGMGIMQFSFI